MDKKIINQVSNRVSDLYNLTLGWEIFKFREKKWKAKIYKGIPFYYASEKSFNNFLSFLISQGSGYIFLQGEHGIKSLANNEQEHTIILEFDVKVITYSAYVDKINNESSFNALNWYMFSEKGNWGIYIDTYYSLFIVGFDTSLEEEICQAFIEEDIISNPYELKEKITETISNQNEIKTTCDTICDNYFSS